MTCGEILFDRILSDVLSENVDFVVKTKDILLHRRFWWYGHAICWGTNNSQLRKDLELEIRKKREKGREECLKTDFAWFGLKKKDTGDDKNCQSRLAGIVALTRTFFCFMLKTNSSKEFFSWKDKYWKYLTIYFSQWLVRNTRLSRNVTTTLCSSPWIPINSFQFSPCLIQECIVTGLMIELKLSGYNSSVIAFGLNLLCRKPGSFAF